MASDPDRLLLVQWKSKAKAKTYFPKDSGYYDWKVKANEVGNWIVHMGRTRQYELSQQKIRFLSELSDDLLQLDNWIELWSLGGDLWASQNLGWRGKSSANTSGSANSQSPIIFQWVDAVLAGNAQKALLLLNQCFEDGSEAIALNGLLAKSLRALVAIKFGEDLSAFHPYQVSRLKRMRVPHLDALLQKSAEIDLKLKSTSADARALIDQLCRLPHS